MFLNVPAVDRVPSPNSSNPNAPTTVLTISNMKVSIKWHFLPSERKRLRNYIAKFNAAMQVMTNIFRQLYPDSKIWLFDTNSLFNKVLDNPDSYEVSSIINNTKYFCEPYGR